MADISTTLELNDSKFQATINKALQSVQNFSSKFTNELNKLNSSFSSLQNTIGAIAVAKFATDISRGALEVKRLSDYTDMSISSILNLRKQFSSVGVAGQQANDAIADFSKNLGEASINGGDVLKALNLLGISLQDIGTLSQAQLWNKAIVGLAGIEDTSTRAAIQTKLFGESTKGIDLSSFSSDIDQYNAALLRQAESTRNAANAQIAFGKFLSSLRNAVLDVISPFASMLSAISQNEFAMNALSKIVITVSGALVGLFIVEKVGSLFTVAAAGVTLFGASLSKVLGWISLLIVAYEGLNYALDKITGSTAKDWILKLADAIFGTKTASEEYTKQIAEEKNESAKLAEVQQRRIELLDKERTALNQSLEAYKKTNQEQIDRIDLETSLIGKGEEAKTKEQALFDQRKRNADEIAALNKKIGETSDPTLKEEYRKQIDRINESYSEQSVELQKALVHQLAKNRANQIALFQTDQLVSSNAKLKEMLDQVATANMSNLEKSYYNLKAAADAAAESAIAAEEKRRGSALSEEERAQYIAAATQKLQEQQAAAYELEKAEAKRSLRLYSLKEQIGLEDELTKIQDDRAKLTLNELEKKYYDIEAAAKARAKAEIEAEAARRGVEKLDPAEEQAYYDAALKNISKLKEATKGQYDESRSFTTGWKQALNEYTDAAGNAAAKSKDFFGKAFKGMEDLVVNFAKTGKFEWKNFVSSMLEELLRAQIQKTFANMFNGISNTMSSGTTGGNGDSGLLSGALNLFSGLFADGGNIPPGHWGIAGEAGPEIINGPATVTPANQLGSGSTNVTYNISAVDAMSFKQLVASDPGFIHAVATKGSRSIPGGR